MSRNTDPSLNNTSSPSPEGISTLLNPKLREPNSRFSEEIAEILSTVFLCNPSPDGLVFYDYVEERKRIPDAPEVDALTPADVHGVFSIHNYDHVNKESWKEFVARVTKVEVTRDENSDPFLPNWASKTDDKPTPWQTDTGPLIATAYKEGINRCLRAASPSAGAKGILELIGGAPTEDINSLIDVAIALEHVSTLLVDGIGESLDDNLVQWRWSRALVMLAGLGFTVLRHFAEHMQEAEPEWGHWATCTDAELRDDIIEARKICCYPIALLRADYKDMQKVVEEGQLSPRWIKALLAVHIFKHVRFFSNYNGDPALWMAYRGEYAHVAFSEEGKDQTLADPVNMNLKQSICRHLGIIQRRGNNRTNLDGMIDDVLAKLHPRDFAKPRDLKDAPQLVVPRSVKITPAHERRAEYKWINPGIMISNLAEIDLQTGKVGKTVVTGPKAVSTCWPRGEMSEAENKTWWANLPKIVKPQLPSEIIRLMFRNINALNHPIGYYALLNASVIIDLTRDELAGSAISNSTINEYPLMMVYPMGHTKETTTNQGKTNYARTLANVFAQGVPVTPSSKTPSAPAQRTMASPIEEFGTALYDEFQLPESHDHFLAQAGLQALSTGGRGGPGRAGENFKGLYLKHPLLFTCKVAAFPPDIRNRTIPTFMDILDEHSRCSSEELNVITSGIISNVIRLSALRWIHAHGFIEKASKAKLVQGSLRFQGHMTVASLLTGGDVTEINAYIKAAEVQCNSQQEAADESGLSDNIGVSSQFDASWFFKNCSEYTIRQLAEITEEHQMMCLPAMRIIIEDVDARRFNDVVKQYGGKERALVLKFSDAIKEGKMTRSDGWEMKWEQKKKKSGTQHYKMDGTIAPSKDLLDCVIVTHRATKEKLAEAAPKVP